ncbi:MAG: glycosyltransferase family 39 protein [Chloroflexi bacterium]|nr:glycosyltransferase family 39 protein [Chloroflexota bacterium]
MIAGSTARKSLGRWALHAILLLALALRLYRLGAANLWWDEALAVWAVRKGLLGATLWTAGDVHPPLYFWSLWGWVQCVGESEFAMRALSAFWGVLTVALVYRLGRLIADGLGGELVGGLGALFTALARFHIWWSQEMRMYVLAGLAGTASLYAFLRWLRAEQDAHLSLAARRAWIIPLGLYIGASIAALYSVLLMGALLFAQNLVVLISLFGANRARRGRLLGHWVVGQLLIAAALAAWMALSWGRMRTWSVSSGQASPCFLVRLYATLLTTGVSVNIERLLWPVVLPFLVLGLGMCCLLRDRALEPTRRSLALLDALTLGLAVALPALAVYIATMPRGLFYTPHVEARYFLPFAAPFWLLLAWSVVLLGRRWAPVGWAAAALVLALWVAFLPGYYRGRYLRDELQTMVRTILSQAEEGDTVILDSGSRYPIFLYYYERVASMGPRPAVETVSQSEDPLSPAQVDKALKRLTAAGGRVWLAEVDVQLTDPHRLVGRWLEARYPVALKRNYGPNALILYSPQGRFPGLAAGYAPQHPLSVEVGGGYLLGWELPVAQITGGATAYVSLLWERVPDGAVQLGLYDRHGRLLMARSAPLEDAGQVARRQQFDFPILSRTPAGSYTLRLSTLGADIPLGTLRIAGTEPLPPAREPDRRYALRVGEGILFEGYRLRDAQGRKVEQAAPGGELILDLYWRAERKLAEEYTVFTHLLGVAHNPRTQGPVWGQHDGQPAEGGYPTSQWLVGGLIVDRHRLVIDAEAPTGEYRLEVGMYTVTDGRRLPVKAMDGALLGDHILLEQRIPIVR